MYVSITTGKDSFRAVPGNPVSSNRKVSVMAYTRVEDKIVPLFEAYKQKIKGFGKQQITASIPASEMFSSLEGRWYTTRCEAVPGTEIMVEYRHVTKSLFNQDIEYALFLLDQNAPLNLVRLHLSPDHEYSSVKYVFFEGRMHPVMSQAMLSDQSIATWRKHLDADEESAPDLGDMFYFDPVEGPHFTMQQLESGVQQSVAVHTSNTVVKGKRMTRITRVRNIKTF